MKRFLIVALAAIALTTAANALTSGEKVLLLFGKSRGGPTPPSTRFRITNTAAFRITNVPASRIVAP